MATTNLQTGLTDALRVVILELSKALITQGHKATGGLIQSFASKVETITGGIGGVVTMNDYGIFVDSGRRAGGKKVPIDALIQWIVVKGISMPDKSTRSLAFAIQNAIFKEGIPTKNSLSKSRTGKRTGFLKEGLDNSLQKVTNILAVFVAKDVEKELQVFVDEANR